MSESSGVRPFDAVDERLTREEFDQMAIRLRIDGAICDELFPMVQDLLVFASKLNRLAPELGQEIGVDALSGGTK